MRYQALFCFFVLSVFVTAVENREQEQSRHYHKNHEQRNQHGKSYKVHHAASRHHKTEGRDGGSHTLKHLLYREKNQHCEWVCRNGTSLSNTSGSGLEVHYNGDSKLLAVVNTTSKVAVVIDYSCLIVALLNGQSGSSFVLDVGSKVIYHVSANSTSDSAIWIASKTTFEAYFKSLSSLDNLLKLAKKDGQKEDLGNLKEDFLTELTADLRSLGVTGSTEVILKYIVENSEKLKSTLESLYKGQGSFHIRNSFHWFFSVNLAVSTLFEGSQGSLNQTVHIDLRAVFNTSSGVEAILNVLTQLGRHYDLSKLFISFFNSPEKCLTLIGEASGGSNKGVDGLLNIVVKIIQVLNGHGSISSVISSIINYNASSEGNEPSLAQIVNQALNLTESQNQLFNNSGAFRAFVNILRMINNNNCIFNNVNISDIIKLLRWNNPRGVMNTIIKIFARFIPEGIPHIFHAFLGLLNSTRDTSVISRFLPGIDLSNFTASGNSSILQRILQGRNLTDLFSGNSNITEVLSHIPIIGSFVREISTAAGNAFNFSRYFNATSIISTFHHALHGIPFVGPFADVASAFASIGAHIGSGIQSGIHSGINTGISAFEHGIGSAIEAFTGGLGGGRGSGSEGNGGGIENIIGSITGGLSGGSENGNGGNGGGSGGGSGGGNGGGSGGGSGGNEGNGDESGGNKEGSGGSGGGSGGNGGGSIGTGRGEGGTGHGNYANSELSSSHGAGSSSSGNGGDLSSLGGFHIPLLSSLSGSADGEFKLGYDRSHHAHPHERHHDLREEKGTHPQRKPDDKKLHDSRHKA